MSNFETQIKELTAAVYSGNIEVEHSPQFVILMFPCKKTAIHLVPVHRVTGSNHFAQLSDAFRERGIRLIHLWEDYWVRKPAIVESRIKAILGSFTAIHARKTEARRIDAITASNFISENHLYGSPSCKYRYGLYYSGQLVAAATFSAVRTWWRNGQTFKSAEMVRFASRNGCSVTGGMGKLLSRFVSERQPCDVMSYADRDWSIGHSYEKLGFVAAGTTPPQQFFINPDTFERHYPHRHPGTSSGLHRNAPHSEIAAHYLSSGYLPVYNAGNIKYLLYIKKSAQPAPVYTPASPAGQQSTPV